MAPHRVRARVPSRKRAFDSNGFDRVGVPAAPHRRMLVVAVGGGCGQDVLMGVDEAATGSRGRRLFSGRDRAVIAAASLSMLLVQMDWFALNLMLPVIARDFSTPTTDLQWLVSGYMLTLGALMITGGRAADVHGRRTVIVWGLTGFALVSVVCAAAQNELWLVVGRVVQGATAALIFPVAVAVVTAHFRDDRQGRAVGTVLAFSAIGTALGPFVTVTLAGSVSNIVYCLVAVLSALYLQQARGLSPLDAGLIFLALSVGAGAASYWSGHLAHRWRPETLMAGGLVLSGLGLLLLTWTNPLALYTAVFAVVGVGLGFGWALTNVATQSYVPENRLAAASGLVLTSLVLLGAMAVAVATTVLEVLSGSAERAASDGPAIEEVLRVAALLSLLGAAALLPLIRAGRRSPPRTTGTLPAP
ncbi:MFS transporter [Streptomyces sp. H27-G5]|uniref:MFS transporter n=1 Tax=Streptomyces sp. H27-G5 TaxID=2996698 RepID=UPI00226E7676|nr:MFS transporter [Streptomyces sp. H27-G5]MCY0922309.1 MFS transporter [Streptomyces sp. H27-G5]